jgi:hypothetical protein
MRKFQLAVGIALLTLVNVGAWAQGVEVNQKDWAGLSVTDRQKITEILKATKLLPEQEEITPSAAARPSAEIVAELAAPTPEAGGAVEINASEWNQLAPNERDQITEIMRATKLIGADQEIVPSEKAPTSREKIAQSPRAAAPTTQAPTQCYVRDAQGRTRAIPCPAGTELGQPEFLGGLCRTACDVAAGVAAAACSGLSSGVGTAVCLAAAEAGRQFCRSRC